jgi:hypothetical protein
MSVVTFEPHRALRMHLGLCVQGYETSGLSCLSRASACATREDDLQTDGKKETPRWPLTWWCSFSFMSRGIREQERDRLGELFYREGLEQ